MSDIILDNGASLLLSSDLHACTKHLIHGSVNNVQDVCVVFIINIFCVKDIEVLAFPTLIVNLYWCGDDSFDVPLGFVHCLLKIYHIRRFASFYELSCAG